MTATLKVKDGEASQFWNVIAFADTPVAELLQLREGESISVQGKLQSNEYEKDGQKRVSLGVVVDHVLALRQPARRKDEPTPAAQRREPVFNDGIPFGEL